MTRHCLPAAAAAIAMIAGSPAFAQTRDSEVDLLRAKVTAQEQAIVAQNAAIAELTARLVALEGNHRARAGADAPKVGEPSGQTDPAGDNIPTIDLDDIPATGSGLEKGPMPAPTWSLAPPGPIDEPLRPAADGHAAAFELLAGTGGGRASFTFTRSRDRGGEPSPEATRVYNDTFTLAISAPLAKDGDTSFATLDGLASGTKLELGYTLFGGRVLTQAEDSRSPYLMRARKRCLDAVPAYKPGCVRLDDDFKRKFMTIEEQNAYHASYARRTLQQSSALSLRGAIGYDEFAYYPLPSLDKATDRKVSWSAGAGFTLFPALRTSASLNLDFQHAFKARKSQTTCIVPPGGGATTTCATGPNLGPEREENLILAPELRYYLPISEFGLIRDLGFAPKVEFDMLSDKVAFDLPIYFAADDKGGLIGGLRFGYLTEDEEFKFGIFIGKSFSLFQ